MIKKILQFNKTDHFLHSQWDRNIDDKLLYKVLPNVDVTAFEKDLVLVRPAYLQKCGIKDNNMRHLIIVLKGKQLLTTFWCDNPDYLLRKEKNAHFQIVKN